MLIQQLATVISFAVRRIWHRHWKDHFLGDGRKDACGLLLCEALEDDALIAAIYRQKYPRLFVAAIAYRQFRRIVSALAVSSCSPSRP